MTWPDPFSRLQALDFFGLLFAEQISAFATIVSTRSSFRLGNYRVDVDSTDFGYTVAEIEVEKWRFQTAEEELAALLETVQSLGFKSGGIRGKIIEYIRTQRPDHWQRLIESEVISDVQK